MNAASNRKPLVFAIVAFLLGVGGTVFGMNLLRPNLPPNVGAEAAAPKDNPVLRSLKTRRPGRILRNKTSLN